MKFLTFVVFDSSKAADIAAATDKLQVAPPKGYNVLNQFVCVSPPFPVPPNSIVGVSITEGEDAEALVSANYTMLLAGATVHRVPLMDVPTSGSVETEKQLRR